MVVTQCDVTDRDRFFAVVEDDDGHDTDDGEEDDSENDVEDDFQDVDDGHITMAQTREYDPNEIVVEGVDRDQLA